MVSILSHITEAKQAEASLREAEESITERNLSEEKLRLSESQLAEAQRLARVGSWNWDIRTGDITWSDELYRIFGLKPQKLQVGKQAIELIHPEDRDLVMSSVETSIKTKEPYSICYRIRRPNGAERIVQTRGQVFCDECGDPIRVFGATQDITEHQQTIVALRLAEQKYRDIFEHAGEGIFQTSRDGQTITANPALARMLGFESPEDLIRERTDIASQHYVDPERRDEFKRLLEEQDYVRGFEYQGYRKDGTTIWLSDSVRAVRNSEGTLLYYEGIAEEITERKRAEKALRESEQQLRLFTQATNDMFWNWDLVCGRVDRSMAFEKTFGYAEEEISSDIAWWEERLHPDDRNRVLSTYEEALMSGVETCSYEYRFRRADNSYATVDDRVCILRDSSGKPIRSLGAMTDITERKEAGEKLRRAQDNYRDIFENAGEGIWQLRPDGELMTANPALANMFGFDSPEELIRDQRDSSPEPYAYPARRAELKRLLDEHGTVRGFERQVLRKDGSKIWVAMNARVVRDQQGKVLHYEGTSQDISEKKRAEMRSELFSNLARKLSGASTQSVAARIIVDSANELFGWDSCKLDLYDAASDLVYPILNVDTIGGQRVDVTTSIETQNPTPRSRRVIDHGPELILREEPLKFDDDSIPFGDKSKPSASLMAVPISHIDNVIGLLAIYRYAPRAYTNSDLKDLHALATYCGAALNRIRTEESLRNSEERYRELFESAKDAYYVHDLSGRYTSVNRAAEKLSGRTRDEIIGRCFNDFIPPEHWETIKEHLCRKLRAEGETTYEIEVVSRDGRRIPVEVSSHLIYENGVAVRVQGTARDITERKRAEEALQRYPRQLIEAQEAERQSIARELHDQIGQVLTAIHLNLRAAWEKCDSIAARALIDEGVGIVDQAFDQVRNLSFELRPSLLDDLGLVAALRWYTDRFAHRTGIHTTTDIDFPELPERLGRELETACFRVAQEALTNVARHAKARNVALKLKSLSHEIRLSIQDDGVGFDLDSQQLAPFATRVGLRGMRERALALGGRLDVRSSPSGGTMICAHFPNVNTKTITVER